jgi:hypothetical protein
MLLPSALPCATPTRSTRLQSHFQQSQSQSQNQFLAQLASPPMSSDEDAETATSPAGLFRSCRALQSMLTGSSSNLSLGVVPAPGLRKRRNEGLRIENMPTPAIAHRKVTKVTRPVRPPPRGANKRRRDAEDEMRREDEEEEEAKDADEDSGEKLFSTPKRQRLAPAANAMPLGLGLADFEALSRSNSRGGLDLERPTPQETENQPPNEEEWTSAEDQQLVELVLEKLKLTKGDWVDCARSLGKNKGSVGRRWKALVGEGNVGLKNYSRPKGRGQRTRGSIKGVF